MKNLIVFTLIAVFMGASFASATGADYRQTHRSIDRKIDRHMNGRHIGTPVGRPVYRRDFRGIVVVRPHGHIYYGYGHYVRDDEAYKWLAFTAITLKILDNLNEKAQREHEAAQVKATTAPVGQEIIWNSNGATGSVVATKEGTNTQGQTCREYQQTVTIGGKNETAFGTACLQADGAWKIIT